MDRDSMRQQADAYALPGRPGWIVVTSVMLRALPADERSALGRFLKVLYR